LGDQWQYLVLMAECLLVTAPLEWAGGGIYHRPGRLVRVLAPIIAMFTIWDILAIRDGQWTFNPRYVTGLQLPGGMPVEELVFFAVVPLCAILTFEALAYGTVRGRGRSAPGGGG
jgi:lycopene cyclase domain-containing protein